MGPLDSQHDEPDPGGSLPGLRGRHHDGGGHRATRGGPVSTLPSLREHLPDGDAEGPGGTAGAVRFLSHRSPGAALPQALEDAAGHHPADSPVPAGQLHRREARVAEPDPKAYRHARQTGYAATEGVTVRNPLAMSQPPRNSSNRPPGPEKRTPHGSPKSSSTAPSARSP